jgi:hypothetical protein
MLAQLGQAIRNTGAPVDRFRVGVRVFLDGNNAVTYTIRQVGTTAEGDKVYTIEDGAGLSQNGIPEDRLALYTAPPQQAPDPAEADRLRREREEAERLRQQAEEAERVARELAAAAAAAAEEERQEAERAAREAAAAAAAAQAAAAGPGAAPVAAPVVDPAAAAAPVAAPVVDPAAAAAPVAAPVVDPAAAAPAPVRRWDLGLPVISFYALFDENSGVYNSLKYIFQAFTVFKTWEFNFNTWKGGDKASAEEWEKFFKEARTFVGERPEIRKNDQYLDVLGIDIYNDPGKGDESGLASINITEDEKQFLATNGIKSLQDFNLSILQTTGSVWKTGNNIISKISESTKDIDAIYDKIDEFVDFVNMKFGELSMFTGGIVLAVLGNIGRKGDWSALIGPGWENVSNIVGFFAYCGNGLLIGAQWIGRGLETARLAVAQGLKFAYEAIGKTLTDARKALAAGAFLALQSIGQGLAFVKNGGYVIAKWLYDSLPSLQRVIGGLGAALLFVATPFGYVYQFTIKAVTASGITVGRFILNIGVAVRTVFELTKLMFTTVVYGITIPIWTLLVWGGYGIVYKGVVWNLVIRPLIGTIKLIWMAGKNSAGRLIWNSADITETGNWYRYLNGNQKKVVPPVAPVVNPAAAAGVGLVNPAEEEEPVRLGPFVRLKAASLAKYPNTSGLKYGMNNPGSNRVRVGKIINSFNQGGIQMIKVRCYNKVAGVYSQITTATYAEEDLETAEKPDGFPDNLLGGYTRRQRVRGMPSRLKTRRTY